MIVLSPTDTLSQGAVVGSAERLVVPHARAPRDAAVQQCRRYFCFLHPDLEFEGRARSVVQSEGIAPEAAPCVTDAPVDLGGHIGVVVDIPRVIYELVRLVVYLARYLYAEYGGGLRHPLHAYTHDLSRRLQYSRLNAAHTTTITSNIFLTCSGDCETTPASSA